MDGASGYWGLSTPGTNQTMIGYWACTHTRHTRDESPDSPNKTSLRKAINAWMLQHNLARMNQ